MGASESTLLAMLKIYPFSYGLEIRQGQFERKGGEEGEREGEREGGREKEGGRGREREREKHSHYCDDHPQYTKLEQCSLRVYWTSSRRT